MATESAVVVGVGPGLGAALVRCFAGEGLRVYAAARSVTRLAALDGTEGVVRVDCIAGSPSRHIFQNRISARMNSAIEMNRRTETTSAIRGRMPQSYVGND